MTVVDLHDEIMCGLSVDFVRRMENWARSLDGGSVTTCSALWHNVGGGSFESRIPVLMGEATDTDRAIRTLPELEQECVAIFWLNRQKPVTWMCRATPRVRHWRMTSAWFAELCQSAHRRLG